MINNRGLIQFPILAIIFIVGIFAVSGISYQLNQGKNRTVSPAPSHSPLKVSSQKQTDLRCTKVSDLAIKEKKLKTVVACEETLYEVNGEDIYFVKISHGELMDCPSGCIQPIFMGIIENEKVIDFSDLREDLLDIEINTKIGKQCNSKQSYDLSLIKINGKYSWKILFLNEESKLCKLKGFILSTDEGKFDLSNLSSEVLELKCNDKATQEEICLKIPDIAYNCSTDEAKFEACNYLKGVSQKLDCDDKIVARRKCVEVNGDSSGKCNDEITNKNYCLLVKIDETPSIEVCDQITGSSEFKDQCYVGVANKLNDPSICHKRELSDFWKTVCNNY